MNIALAVVSGVAILVAAFLAFVVYEFSRWCGELQQQCGTVTQERNRLQADHNRFWGDTEPARWIFQSYKDIITHHHTEIDGLHQQIKRLERLAFRLPKGEKVRLVSTPIGSFAIRTIRGYYGDSAIFVYFPLGFGFSQEIANALRVATDGRFIMEPAPGSSSGGDNAADAIIELDLDHEANLLSDEQGHFESPSLDLDEIASILERIIVHSGSLTTQP